MHPGLACLPDLLLQHLGRCSELRYLQWAIDGAGLPSAGLFAAQGDEPSVVAVGSVGVDLLVQRIQAESPDASALWGVQGISLISRHADPTRYLGEPWPFNLAVNARPGVKPAELISAVPDLPRSEALVTDRLVCAPLPGRDGQAWAMLAQFAGRHRVLHTLSILRQGPWELASVIPAWAS